MRRLAAAGAMAFSLVAVGAGADARAQAPSSSVAARADLPASTGVDVAKGRCIGCHEADLIVSQRLSQGGWDRELAKMERWGAKLSADERATLLAYLTREFGVRPAASHEAAAVTAGEATFKAACLGCHGEDLSMQQRLTAAGWGREVDKMVRWGAKVPADDKAALVAYLTSRWGPR